MKKFYLTVLLELMLFKVSAVFAFGFYDDNSSPFSYEPFNDSHTPSDVYYDEMTDAYRVGTSLRAGGGTGVDTNTPTDPVDDLIGAANDEFPVGDGFMAFLLPAFLYSAFVFIQKRRSASSLL